jgi:hypothetical protein
MKYPFLILMILSVVSCNRSLKSRASDPFTSAINYNNYIIERQKSVGGYISSFYKVFNKDTDSAKSILQSALSRMQESLDEIMNMPSFKGDSAFRHSAGNSFRFYVRLFSKDYPEILTLHSKKQGMDEADQLQEERITNQIIRDEDQVDKDLHNRQRDFAEKFHMRLIKPENEEDKE